MTRPNYTSKSPQLLVDARSLKNALVTIQEAGHSVRQAVSVANDSRDPCSPTEGELADAARGEYSREARLAQHATRHLAEKGLKWTRWHSEHGSTS
jgi:hypothetical protein